MGELYNPFPRLPKNIRQIGERDQTVRLYLEDYVNTYLRRLYPKGGQDLRVGLLLGTSEEHDGTPYLFVDGALEMDDVAENSDKVILTESAWKKAYKTMEDMFPKREIMGWFLCGESGTALSPLNYWKQHGQYFSKKNQLMYLNSGLEGEEAVYITSEDGFYKLQGYSIYYERNQMMQDYMILRKDARRVESGSGDSVIRDFRHRMEENKSQAVAQRGTIRVLGTMCSALAVVVLAGGVTMFNNYEKMKDMEAVLTSALPGEAIAKAGEEAEGEELWIEEASGNVYPTAAHETMSATYPEGQAGMSNQQADETKAAQEGNQEEQETEDGGGETESGKESGTGSEDSTLAENGSADSSDSSDSIHADNRLQAGEGTIYTVQDGETLYGICLKIYGNGSMLSKICELNGLEDENKIISGQNLILP